MAALLATLTLATLDGGALGSSTQGAPKITYQIFLFLALVLDALAVAAQATVGTDLGAGCDAEEKRGHGPPGPSDTG